MREEVGRYNPLKFATLYHSIDYKNNAHLYISESGYSYNIQNERLQTLSTCKLTYIYKYMHIILHGITTATTILEDYILEITIHCTDTCTLYMCVQLAVFVPHSWMGGSEMYVENE